ncbi:MAG: hypothetical protein NTX50_31070 [Candidatus Sumerlaeota bacterium]|nr:hypothetical protein [Candidatus Sumerlaeota bacterium]
MSATVEKIMHEIEALPEAEFDHLLSSLAKYEAERMDDWDREIQQDALSGGRLQPLIERARRDISAGRTKPLDEILDHS